MRDADSLQPNGLDYCQSDYTKNEQFNPHSPYQAFKKLIFW